MLLYEIIHGILYRLSLVIIWLATNGYYHHMVWTTQKPLVSWLRHELYIRLLLSLAIARQLSIR